MTSSGVLDSLPHYRDKGGLSSVGLGVLRPAALATNECFSPEKPLSRVPLDIPPQVTLLSELYFASLLDCREVLCTEEPDNGKHSGQHGPRAKRPDFESCPHHMNSCHARVIYPLDATFPICNLASTIVMSRRCLPRAMVRVK